jgi:mono/diheme cytochrome c family protein
VNFNPVNLRRFGVAVVILASVCVLVISTSRATAQDTAKSKADTSQVNSQSAPLSVADAKKLKNPVPFTKKSIAQGRAVYMRNCTMCHGSDGKATEDVVSNATDLTSPKLWRNGTSDGEIFRDIRDGVGEMPALKSQIHQAEDLWNLVNFVRSLWPESMRPALQESGADEPPANKNQEQEKE